MAVVVNENEVQKQIENMTALIDQEANEKVEEIEAKTEEEFQIEKSKIVGEQKTKILEYYTKKENQIKLEKHIQNSNKMNTAKLKILSAKQAHIKTLLELSKKKLGLITSDVGIYKETLKQLINQGFLQLLEREVVIRCLQKDVEIIKSILPNVIEDYRKITSRTINVGIDSENYLQNIMGGVEVLTLDGRLRVVNTLDSRLTLLSEQMIPELREIMFGCNTNRKFND